MRKDILEASRLHFKAHIEKHRVNIENLLENGVGVAEHPDIMQTVEKELEIIAEYDDQIQCCRCHCCGVDRRAFARSSGICGQSL